MLLDEPVAGLDPQSTQEILRLVKTLARERGLGVVLSSHVSDELSDLPDFVLMLRRGQVVEYAPRATLFQSYGLARLEDIFIEAVKEADPGLSRRS
jgi:ABC-2 type transport system ATP-binding protein